MNEVTKTVSELITRLVKNDQKKVEEKDKNKKDEIDNDSNDTKASLTRLINQSTDNRASPLTSDLSINFTDKYNKSEDRILALAVRLSPDHKEIVEQLCKDFPPLPSFTKEQLERLSIEDKPKAPILEAINVSLQNKKNNHFQLLIDHFITQNKITYMEVANFNFIFYTNLDWAELSDENLHYFMNKFCDTYSADDKERANAMKTLQRILLKAASQETRFDIILEYGLKLAEDHEKEWQEHLNLVLAGLLQKTNALTSCLQENHSLNALNNAVKKLLINGAELKIQDDLECLDLNALLNYWNQVQTGYRLPNSTVEVMDQKNLKPICHALRCRAILKKTEEVYTENNVNQTKYNLMRQLITDAIACDENFLTKYLDNRLEKSTTNPNYYNIPMLLMLVRTYCDIKHQALGDKCVEDKNYQSIKEMVVHIIGMENGCFFANDNEREKWGCGVYTTLNDGRLETKRYDIKEEFLKEWVDNKLITVTFQINEKYNEDKDKEKNNSNNLTLLGLFDNKIANNNINNNVNNSSNGPKL